MTIVEELERFARAVAKLDEVLPQMEQSEPHRDAAIKRFEIAFELGWKTLRRVLSNAHGIEANSPRVALTQGYALGLVADEAAWVSMLKDRNVAAHTYEEAMAIDLARRLPEHTARLRELLKMLEATR